MKITHNEYLHRVHYNNTNFSSAVNIMSPDSWATHLVHTTCLIMQIVNSFQYSQSRRINIQNSNFCSRTHYHHTLFFSRRKDAQLIRALWNNSVGLALNYFNFSTFYFSEGPAMAIFSPSMAACGWVCSATGPRI